MEKLIGGTEYRKGWYAVYLARSYVEDRVSNGVGGGVASVTDASPWLFAQRLGARRMGQVVGIVMVRPQECALQV